MPQFHSPTPPVVQEFLASQANLSLTYAAAGATRFEPPAGYAVDRTRVHLGAGEDAFRAARAALERWDQFRLGWVEARPASTPVRTGVVVAVVARVLGMWWLNACRVVYVVDET